MTSIGICSHRRPFHDSAMATNAEKARVNEADSLQRKCFLGGEAIGYALAGA